MVRLGSPDVHRGRAGLRRVSGAHGPPAGLPGTGSPRSRGRLAGRSARPEPGGVTTTPITGADKGLGFETARRLVAAGHTVHVGSRDLRRGRRAVERLGARMVRTDVTDDVSVAAAAKAIEADGGPDVLVNNAGVEARSPDGGVTGAEEVTAEAMRTVSETNVFGVVRVTHGFLPRGARHPRVPAVAATLRQPGRGQRQQRPGLTDPDTPAHAYPGVAHPASKAAPTA